MPLIITPKIKAKAKLIKQYARSFDEFTPEELAKLAGIDVDLVQQLLVRMYNSGHLERVRPGVFRIVDSRKEEDPE